MSADNEKLKKEMTHSKKSRNEILRNMEGMEQRMAFLEDQNTTLVHENNRLKDDNMKIYRFVKGLEWDIETFVHTLRKNKTNMKRTNKKC